MKRPILISLMLLAILPLSSCKKFLEEQSQTDIIPRTASALNELLIGSAYRSTSLQDFMCFMDDDIVHNAYTPETRVRFGAYTWQPETAILPEQLAGARTWGIMYPMIMTCNMILEYTPKVTGTTTEIENVEGQAYLLRAYYYFMLVNYYGKPYTDRLSDPEQDLGVPLMLSGSLSLEGKPRNTVAEVYRQILSDLDKGIALMERSGTNNNLYRISHIAGYLLASRVNLYMGNWQKAVDAATNVLNRKSTLMDLPAWGSVNQNTKPVVDLRNPETIWGHGSPYEVILRTNEEKNYRLSDELLALFETGDLRRTIYISNASSIKYPGLIYSDKVGHTFRVSEALLNRAEAYAQLNKTGQAASAQLALNDLNTLRKKRFSGASYQDLGSTGADDLLQKCADERRRELFNEESHRWFDLRRSGMPAIRHIFHENNGQTLTYILQERDPAYLLQIPQSVLDNNPKLIPNPAPAVRSGQ
ncbi:hypothetical protein ABIE26_004099 [Pedobacter africanus]|uniref:Uncharacterized protein n=1 Tax=Pedobacter africanus TaxID=151894 RepID=A0ACC6L1L1_9SPHI|nr:RagB/SusD family nutrient uptake outer membrane protein [Pedobacter africanus]MDR6785389.1 hypothetical protein [Pedobacter africanus]